MKRRTGLLVAIGIGLSCERTDPREGQGLRGAAATRLAADANPQCTMPATWDPIIGQPSPEALQQLAPTGQLRVGVYTGNRAVAQLNGNTGALTGPAIDLSCRLATQLNLPLLFTSYPTIPVFQRGFVAGTWEIGFSTDEVFIDVPDAVPSHAYIAIDNTLMVANDSPILHVRDANKPGIKIAVQKGNTPNLYMRANFKDATLVEIESTSAANDVFPLVQNGTVDAAAGGRPGLSDFVANAYPGGRVLPDTLVDARLAPFVRPNNGDALCYLAEYIEGARATGMLAQIRLRLGARFQNGNAVSPSEPGCAPAAKCKDMTVAADASCHASASINAGASDADSDLVACTQSPAGPYPLGATPVTLTCTDTEGQSASCTASVTVVDTTPPVIACPANQTLECTNEGAVATFAPTATDNCRTASVQCTPPSGTTFSEDAVPTAVSCVAVDTSGNQAACGFQIAVQDTLPPVVTPKLEANGFSATLWPPNHSYHTVSLSDCIQSVADQCDGALPVRGTILRVTSDESESGGGEGDDGTCDDIVLVDSTTVKLRAERSDESDGRVYSIFAMISDDHGNQAPLTCKVQVPRHHKTTAVEGAAVSCVGQGCGGVPGNGLRCRSDDDGDRGDDGDTRHGNR